MEFNKAYNRQEFVNFLHHFLPDDLTYDETHVELHTKMNYTQQAVKLGASESLDLVVYEVKHNSKNDARVSLSKEVFRLLADEMEDRALVIFVPEDNSDNYRFSFIEITLDAKDDSSRITRNYSNPRRYSYYLGEGIAARTPKEYLLKKTRVQSISDLKSRFSVEILNDNFFREYKDQYNKFCDFLQQNQEMRHSFKKYKDQDKAIRDYIKKMIGRIVFLYFVQRKGWLNGDPRYMSNMFDHSSDAVKSDFLDMVLEPMFFGLLNTPEEQRIANAKRHNWNLSLIPGWEHIPYLNGGLFEQNDIDKCKSIFPKEYFRQLFDFFDTYNFTIDENAPDDSEVGIDPEMLGHIFENLLEDNKDKGAFYTPKEIVQYMCRQSVIQYLKTQEPDEQYEDPIIQLINNGIVMPVLQPQNVASRFMKLLKDVKVCDPAIGSGAFPIGILYVLYHAIHHLQPHAEPHGNFDSIQTKRDIIQNNIFGVDIEQGAVDIARLRFWLALVVDADVPQPLPNLDYKITCGNSILHRFSFDVPIENVFTEYNKNKQKNERISLSKYKEKVYQFTETSNHDKKEEFRNIIEQVKTAFRSNLSDKDILKIKKIRKQIFDLEAPLLFGERTKEEKNEAKKLHKQLAQIEKEHEDIKNNKIYEHSFEWRFEFPALLNDEGDFIGFDIIIGNPPFGAKLSNIEKNLFKEYYSDVHMRTPETYCYFISLAFKLVNLNGIVSYIVPNNMFFQNENEKTRSLLLFSHQLIRAINLGDNTFENADVPTCIFIAKSKKTEHYEVKYSDYRKYNISDIEWDKDYESISTELIKTVPAYVLGLSNVNIRIINEIKRHGVLIDSIAEEMASGISTGGDKIFKIDKSVIIDFDIEENILRKVLVGSDIEKYSIAYQNSYLIYTTRETSISNFPKTEIYLEQYKDKLMQRSESKKGILPWYSLGRNRYPLLFEEPKIIMRQTSDNIRCVFDENGYYVLNSILVLKLNNQNYNYKYLATVLNSTCIDFLYKNLTQEEGRTFAEVKPANVRKLYIPKATIEEQRLLSILYDYLVFLKKPQQPEPFISLNSMFIDLFEKIIDGCVYELFFREHMKEREIDIMNHLYQKIISIDGLSDEDKNNTIISVHSSIFMTDNPVRTRLKLFVSRSQEFLKPIIQH